MTIWQYRDSKTRILFELELSSFDTIIINSSMVYFQDAIIIIVHTVLDFNTDAFLVSSFNSLLFLIVLWTCN